MNESIETTAFSNHVSLGYSCSVRKALVELGVATPETQLFDWIGTSAWAIVPVLRDPFCVSLSTLVPWVHHEGENALWTHTGLNVRFMHEFKKDRFPSGRAVLDLHLKMLRRKQRFQKFLEEKTLFYRLEEPQESRCFLRSDFRKEEPETVYLKNFLTMCHPDSRIIYFTSGALDQHIDDKITRVPVPENVSWDNNMLPAAVRTIVETIR